MLSEAIVCGVQHAYCGRLIYLLCYRAGELVLQYDRSLRHCAVHVVHGKEEQRRLDPACSDGIRNPVPRLTRLRASVDAGPQTFPDGLRPARSSPGLRMCLVPTSDLLAS